MTVTRVSPEVAPFAGLLLVSTGESYVNSLSPVPTTPLMRKFVLADSVGWPAGTAHTTDVSDLHDVVEHVVTPSSTVEDVSDTRKFTPERVIVVPAVTGELRAAEEVTVGGSNENVATAEWVAPAMLVRMVCGPAADVVGGTHTTEEDVVHDVVEQDAPMVTVSVGSLPAKFKPESVTTVPPVVGAFVGKSDVTTGASNEKESPVFDREESPSVTPMARLEPPPRGC